MTTESINIVITEDGSRNVTVNISNIGGAAERSSGQVDLLNKALGVMGTVLAVDKIIKYADAWNSADGIIAIATKTTEEQVAVQEKLFKAAQDTRQSFDELVGLYRRVAQAQNTLGASQNQMIAITKEVGEALVIQHTSAGEAQGALLQLGHALDSGRVTAREFNSINLTLGTVMQVVADHVQGAGGSIANLRALMNQGKLMSKVFFDAMLDGQSELDEKFAKSAVTFAQGFTVITNAFEKYIGQLNESQGLSAAFLTVARFIADNMKLLGSVLISVGAAIAVAFGLSSIEAFYGAVVKLFVLINTNPFVTLASAIAGAVVFFSQYGDQLNAGIDKQTTMNDLWKAFGSTIVDAGTGLKDFFTAYVENAETDTNTVLGYFHQFFSDTKTGFAGFLQVVARTIDAIAGLITGLNFAIGNAIEGIPSLFSNAFKQAANFVIDTVEGMVNEVIESINRIRSVLGKDPIELISFARLEVDTDYAKKYGASIANGIDQGFEEQGGFLEKALNGVFDKAAANAAARTAAAVAPKAVDLDTHGTPLPGAVDPKKVKSAESALRALEDRVNPAAGALLEFAKAQETVNTAISFGLIDQIQGAALLGDVTRHYKDAIDPIGAVSRGIEEQTGLLKFNGDEQAIQTQLLAIGNDLKKKGVAIGDDVFSHLRKELEAQVDLNRVNAATNSLLDASVQKRKQFAAQIQGITALLQNPSSGFSNGDAAQSILSQFPDLLANTQTFADANVAIYKNMYDQIDQLLKANLISDQTAQVARQNIAIQSQAVQAKQYSDFFGNLATLSQLGNKKLAAIGKAAAIAQASIDGYVAIQKAYASAPYPYDIPAVIAVGVATAANVARIAGFESGGYTGNAGTSAVAGVVHGQEFVVNADGTSKNRAALEAMNAGATVGGGQTVVQVSVINQSSNSKTTTKEKDTPNGKMIEVMITDIVSQDIAKNGPISQTVQQQFGLNRSAGVSSR